MKLRYVFVSVLWRGGGGGGADWRYRNRDIQRKSLDGEREMILFFLPVFFFFPPECFDLPASESRTQTAGLCLNWIPSAMRHLIQVNRIFLCTNQLLKRRDKEKDWSMPIEYKSIGNDISGSRWKREPSIKVRAEEDASSLFNITLWRELHGNA